MPLLNERTHYAGSFSRTRWVLPWNVPEGTGKILLISLILAEIRLHNGIALAVASSGIAATLLNRGRIAHSEFKLTLNGQNNPDAVCNIKNGVKLLSELNVRLRR